MMFAGRTTFTLSELQNKPIQLPHGGTVQMDRRLDSQGESLTRLLLNNGKLALSILPERGMEVGEIFLSGEKMSWERSSDYGVHPNQVDLHKGNGTGWMDGFYSAAAVIGPELFGTPGEGLTLHGTGSYSITELETICIEFNEEGLQVVGVVPCRGYSTEPIFKKKITIFTRWNSSLFMKEEATTNLSDQAQILDDGHHIQLSGPFLHQGGRYVIPAERDNMFLRDHAPGELDPLLIPALDSGAHSIRCYEYVPEPVQGLDQIEDIRNYLPMLNQTKGITAEMIVNRSNSGAGYIIRPLASFPRSLIAKEISDSFMFALEPCRTRPNVMSQKIHDGEAFFLESGTSSLTQCLIGVSRDAAAIRHIEQTIIQSIKF